MIGRAAELRGAALDDDERSVCALVQVPVRERERLAARLTATSHVYGTPAKKEGSYDNVKVRGCRVGFVQLTCRCRTMCVSTSAHAPLTAGMGHEPALCERHVACADLAGVWRRRVCAHPPVAPWQAA